MIQNENIKVISFDIFDTLLFRPCLLPKDIFYLIAQRVNEKFNIDFIQLRLNAEQLMGTENANIYEIYKWIGLNYGIPSNVCAQLLKEEVKTEKELLSPRQEIAEIYDLAIRSGKRVIATSDMYLTRTILADILKDKGFNKISEIYVSNEYKKRKNYGDLYEVVLQSESCKAGQLLHIGDNIDSDYKIPLNKGIVAFYYPNLTSILFSGSSNTLWKKAFQDIENIDPFCRILLGVSFSHYSPKKDECNSSAMFDTTYSLGRYGLGPVVVAMMLKVLNSHELRKYKKIYFASRDGYIPCKIYNLLKKHVPEGADCEYFQAGRSLYYSALNHSFESFIYPNTYGYKLTIVDFLERYIHDKKIKEQILRSLTDSDKAITIQDTIKWKEFFCKHKTEIEDFIIRNNLNLTRYYHRIFSKDFKHLVFDCGYSGSISRSLSKIMKNHVFDKLYLWQTAENKEWDTKSGTKTFSLFGDINFEKYGALHLIFEELFSPLDMRAIAVNDRGEPIFISEPHSKKMVNEIQQCQQGIYDFCSVFLNTFKNYVSDFEPHEIKSLLNGLNEAFNHSPYCEGDLLRNIIFPDAFTSQNESLAHKIEKGRKFAYPLIGTGFVNPDNYIKDNDVYPIINNPFQNLRIGVHFHLYDPSLIDEVLCYLKNLPPQTDVYVTTPKKSSLQVFKDLLSIADNLKNAPQILFTPNKGRDVAPWLLGMKDIQNNYDVFGHFHGKRSPQNGIYGEIWRKYLLKNLLSEKALMEIFTIFGKDPKIGCIFPGPYNQIMDIYRTSTIEVISENKQIFEELVRKMTLQSYEVLRSDMFYSVGTMFWYRPDALQALFDLNLTIDDFPEEPLGLDGTLPHALERIFKVACEYRGYTAKAWTSTYRDLTLGYMHNSNI